MSHRRVDSACTGLPGGAVYTGPGRACRGVSSPGNGLLSPPAPVDPRAWVGWGSGCGGWNVVQGRSSLGAKQVCWRMGPQQWPRAQCDGCLWLVTRHRTRPDGARAEKVLVWTCTRVRGSHGLSPTPAVPAAALRPPETELPLGNHRRPGGPLTSSPVFQS